MADSPWDETNRWRVIRREVVPHFEPIEAWIVDETGWLKQGKNSPGVAHQYCGAVGKQANCQVSVELVVSDEFLWRRRWAGDYTYRKAGLMIPNAALRPGRSPDVGFATKNEIALTLIEEALADQVVPAPVLGDAAYGNGFAFRERLRELDLEFFLQVTPEEHKAWIQEVPTTLKGKYRIVDEETSRNARNLLEIAASLPAEAWRHCWWKAATGARHHTRIAWQEVYLARGLKEPQGHLEKLWLVVDWPKGAKEPYHCYLAHFHREPSKALCLKLSRSRWHVEQYFQRSKDDLGLDHYEGRSWRGFHHHLVMSAIAYLFILTTYLAAKKNFWSDVGEDPGSDPAVPY